jgi:hypothetical protein
MKQNIYNAKFKTKQIFDLDCNYSGTPESNEVYYWFSLDNGKLFSNYKLENQSIIK